MTLMGMQDYLNQNLEKNINDTWTLESNVLTFDKDTLLDTIMLDAGQLGINTTNPEQFYRQCAMFWNKWKYTFQKWWEVAEKEYQPLWNTEWWEDGNNAATAVGSRESNSSSSESMSDNAKGTLRAPGTSGSNGTTVENSVSAFDSNTYQPHDKSVSTTTRSEDTTSKDDRTTQAAGTSNEDTTQSQSATHDIYKRGNIGVMSTQSLKEETFNTEFHYNPYNLMSAVFIKEMTCAVW